MKSTKNLLFPLLLVFYEMATYLSNDMYLPALPQIAVDLHITQAQVQWSLTAWFLGATSIQLFLGPLSDRYGRRPILLIGGIIFIIATFICALAAHLHILLVARFLQGTAICSMITAGYASIHELYDQAYAIRLLALMGSISVLAPAFGPLVGNILLYLLHWQWIFWFLFIWGIVAISFLFKWMPETNPPTKRRSIEIKQLIKNYWLIITNLHFAKLTFIFCLLFCNLIVWLAAAPFIVAKEFHYSIFIFSYAQILIFGCFILANRLIRRLLDLLGVEKLIRVGLLTALSGSILMVVLALIFPRSFSGIVVGMIMYAAGAALAFSPLNRLAIEATPVPMGARVAMFSTCMSAASILGSLFASFFYQQTVISFAYIIGIIMLIASVVYFGLPIPKGPSEVHSQ